MRDPGRIARITEVLRGAWESQPDLRLGQLISNACPDDVDLFYVEDEVWEDRLWRSLVVAGRVERCRYTFGLSDGTRCQAVAAHPIHHGVNDGPDHAHEFAV